MGIDYTTNELVNNVKRRVTVPTSQNFFLPNNIIAFANDEMHSTIVPAIISIREEYYVTSSDVAIDTTVDTYRIPSRAVGGQLRDVVLVDSSGNEVGVPRLMPESIKSESSLTNVRLSGIIVKDDSIVLYPSAQAFSQVTIRFKFMRRPNNLIGTSSAGYITGINTGTNEVTLSNVPTAWSASMTFDVIRQNPIFTSVVDDQTITNITGTVLTFSSIPNGLALGQWVAEAGFTPIPQMPYEAQQTLSQYTGARMLDSTGDKANAKIMFDKADLMKEALLKILTPRIEGSNKKINTRTGLFQYTGNQFFELRT